MHPVIANVLLHVTGGDNGASPWYLEESGFVGLLMGAGFISSWYKKHNCHQGRCWRIGLHGVGDGSLVVCKKHHPDHKGVKITDAYILSHHNKSKSS